mgnify:CR=1 FL=1
MKKSSKKIQNSENDHSGTIAERLGMAIVAMGYRNPNDFIEDIGVNKSTIYAILNGKTKDPGSRILKKCYQAGINLNWLIAGEEEMLVARKSGQTEAASAAAQQSKPYPKMSESHNIEEKIRDTMDDMLGMYQRLKRLRDYATELEKLEPDQEKLFHNLVKAFLESSKKER